MQMNRGAIAQTSVVLADYLPPSGDVEVESFPSIKRILDISLASVLLIICVPVLIVASVLVLVTEGMPITYGHQRIGKKGTTFDCYKFRTMVTGFNFTEYLETSPAAALEWKQNQKLDNDPRVTRIGRWLRRMNLDELPQLLNILRGDMSFVGPRPVTETELARYGADVDKYLSVTPGLTGLWQINGRNRLSYAERVALDVRYVATRSIWLDLAILLRTAKVLVLHDGK
jgi:exopolysaccharide production protein ExoY